MVTVFCFCNILGCNKESLSFPFELPESLPDVLSKDWIYACSRFICKQNIRIVY